MTDFTRTSGNKARKTTGGRFFFLLLVVLLAGTARATAPDPADAREPDDNPSRRRLVLYTGLPSPVYEITEARLQEAFRRLGLAVTVQNLSSQPLTLSPTQLGEREKDLIFPVSASAGGDSWRTFSHEEYIVDEKKWSIQTR